MDPRRRRFTRLLTGDVHVGKRAGRRLDRLDSLHLRELGSGGLGEELAALATPDETIDLLNQIVG